MCQSVCHGKYNKLAHINHDLSYQSVVINYVSEHHLPYVVNAFHTTPITHVNWGLILLKLIGWRYCLYLSGSRTYPRPLPRLLALNLTLPLGSHVTCIT